MCIIRTLRLLVFLLNLSLVSLFLFGQDSNQEKINQIEKNIEKAKGRAKIDLLFELAKLYAPLSKDKAISKAEDALKLLKKEKPDQTIEIALNGFIGETYCNINDYKKSVKYYENELEIIKSLNLKQEEMELLFLLGTIHKKIDKHKKAIEYFEESMKIAESLNSTFFDKCRAELYLEYIEVKDFQNAHKYLKLMMSEEYEKKLASMESKYQLEKTEKENIKVDLKKKDTEIVKKTSELNIKIKQIETKDSIIEFRNLQLNNIRLDSALKTEQLMRQEEQAKSLNKELETQKKINILIVSIIVIISTFLFLVLILYRQKRRANIKLAEQKTEIEKQNEILRSQKDEISSQRNKIENQRDLLAKQNLRITESIQYASNIQNTILPPADQLNTIFKDHFILFKPKDIVSGDFYWFEETEKEIILVVADCTGHGVPGAFMSMLGVTLLNEIINKFKITKPIEILEQLRASIKRSLHQTGKSNETKDGMDIALCTINKSDKTAEFAGAYNPLYILRDEEKITEELRSKCNPIPIIMFEGDRMPIGIYIKEQNFTNQRIQLLDGDCLYMFSDGFVDQFGGDKNNKFKATNFKKLLIEIYQKPLVQQKQILDETIENWKGNREQVDDILIFGIRI